MLILLSLKNVYIIGTNFDILNLSNISDVSNPASNLTHNSQNISPMISNRMNNLIESVRHGNGNIRNHRTRHRPVNATPTTRMTLRQRTYPEANRYRYI